MCRMFFFFLDVNKQRIVKKNKKNNNEWFDVAAVHLSRHKMALVIHGSSAQPERQSGVPSGYYSKYRHYLYVGFHSPSPQNNNSRIKMNERLFEIKISSWE